MAHAYSDVGGIVSFPVVVSNPSGNIVRFVITDASNRLTAIHQIKAVLCKAITTWLAAERADLDANGDTDIVGETDYRPGDGYDAFEWTFGSKQAEVTLTAKTNLNVSQTITASIPFAATA